VAPAATETTEPLIVPPVWADAVAANDRDNSAIAMPSRVKVQKDNVVVLMGSASSGKYLTIY
jgi:phosphoribosylcarboxyaminoimidazole (NCAIR) mutase